MVRAKHPRTKNCEVCTNPFEYYSSAARFCSSRCKALSATSAGVVSCSICGNIGKQTRTHKDAYTCEKCRAENPKHGRGHYMRTRCPCTVCREDVNRYQRQWCLRYFERHGQTYSSSFDYEYWYVSQNVRFRIYERDGWQCQLCAQPIDFSSKVGSALSPTLDHIVCQSWTETPDHSTSNLRLVCKSCNSSRRDAPEDRAQWLLDPIAWEILNRRPNIDLPL